MGAMSSSPTMVPIKVLLLNPTPKERFERIRAALPPNIELRAPETDSKVELAGLLADAVVLVGNGRADDKFLDLAPNVRFLQRTSAGYDQVDIDAVKRRGILVAANAGANSTPVAEFTVMLILALLKRLVPSVNATHTGEWPRGQFSANPDLEGQKVGIVGFGAIGQAVAARLHAFGCTLRYYSRHRAEASVEKQYHVEYLPLDDLLAASSILTLHVPLNDQTRKFMGDAEFARMPQGSLFINTARGDVIDEGALVRALQSGHLGGAALDVLESEASGPNPLYHLPNVIVSPHTAGSSRLGAARSLQNTIDNIIKFSRGEEPAGIISELRNRD